MRFTGIMITVAVMLFGCAGPMSDRSGLNDIFELLEQQGYTANVGLSGIYEPGNLIQTTQEGPGGKPVALGSPIIFSWGSDCFSDRTPRIAPFVLSDSQGSEANSISLGASIVNLFMPSLKLSHQSLADYRLDLENPQVYTFAKGDLSRQFSEKCVQSLANALEDGDKIEWFSIIIEAVTVDALTLEMNWRSGSSAEGRIALQDQIIQQLGSILKGYSKDFLQAEAGLQLITDNEKNSVIKTDGPVIIGYRGRPLLPVYEK
jgi:hypothetical protein